MGLLSLELCFTSLGVLWGHINKSVCDDRIMTLQRCPFPDPYACITLHGKWGFADVTELRISQSGGNAGIAWVDPADRVLIQGRKEGQNQTQELCR